MPFSTCLQIALAALVTNKVRTMLTMLGIIIGVGAVIAMVSIGNGASQKVQQQVSLLGENLITITPGNAQFKHLPGLSPDSTTTLTLQDSSALQQQFPGLIAGACPLVRGMATVQKGNQTAGAQVTGTTPQFPAVMNRTVRAGSFINQQEEEDRAKVALIGTTVVQTLFGSANANPIGSSILINHVKYTIQGVLQPRGSSDAGHDLDDIVMVPLSTAFYRILNQKWLSEIDVQAAHKNEMPIAVQQITQMLRQRHHIHTGTGAPDDFTVRNQTAVMEASRNIAGAMTILLGGIAGVSLAVGGIGIMNIMLVSVQERTREIGLRKAIGAKKKHILLQFMVESVIMSLLGGAAGVLTGVGSVAVFVHLLHGNALVSMQSIVTALLVSAGVGMFFGIYPAQLAAKLNPIEALRHE